jgi:phosphotransferase system enzyme I (PtsI)
LKIKGTTISQGIAIGRAHLLDVEKFLLPSYEINDEEVESEVNRFNSALKLTVEEIEEIKEKTRQSASDEAGAIFDVHIAILNDPALKRNTVTRIIKERKNAELAFATSIKNVVETLEKSSDPYFRERAIDIRDLARRVISNLQGKKKNDPPNYDSPILVSSQLSPSQTSALHASVKGFVTEHGGKTSHTAIIARSLEIPAVIGVKGIVEAISPGDEIIIDGIDGVVIIKPTQDEKDEYLEKLNAFKERRSKLLEESKKPSKTVDGHNIKIRCNIDFEEELKKVNEFGVEGVGLYRSEFLYLNCAPELPSEEEHFETYKRIAEAAYPFKAVIRTLDLGGEKYFQEQLAPQEVNPVLGLRAIRFSLRHHQLFKTQLRGILRASTKKNLEIMFPMITIVEELKTAKDVLKEAMQDLKREGVPFDEEIKVGIMIEIPICALNAEAFASDVDFFSIGTNDLIQYLMAIDRSNESVAGYYDPYHPAFLRLLLSIASVAKRNKIGLSICGEVASDPDMIPLLIGLGYDEFSMTPQSVLEVKSKIISLLYKECRKVALDATKMKTGRQVRNLLKGGKVPSFLGIKWGKTKDES